MIESSFADPHAAVLDLSLFRGIADLPIAHSEYLNMRPFGWGSATRSHGVSLPAYRRGGRTSTTC